MNLFDRMQAWESRQPPWKVKAIYAGYTLWWLGVAFGVAFICGMYYTCDRNDGVLLGNWDCVLNKCIQDYDVVRCNPGTFSLFYELPGINITANGSDTG